MLDQFEDIPEDQIKELSIPFWFKYEAHLLRHPISGKWHIDLCERKPFKPWEPNVLDLGQDFWGDTEMAAGRKWGDYEFDTPQDAIKFLKPKVRSGNRTLSLTVS
jgi:hypothetical protein